MQPKTFAERSYKSEGHAGAGCETDLWHDAPEKRSELAQREKKGKEKERERERETEQTKGATHATGQQHKHTLTTLTK